MQENGGFEDARGQQISQFFSIVLNIVRMLRITLMGKGPVSLLPPAFHYGNTFEIAVLSNLGEAAQCMVSYICLKINRS